MEIKERNVSKELALLLKENGFDWETLVMYNVSGDRSLYDSSAAQFMSSIDVGNLIPAPNYHTVLEWMRVKKDMFISIAPYSDEEREMLNLPTDIKYEWSLYFDSTGDIRPYEGRGRTVEETIEDAVTHCLTDAIN